LPGRIEYARSEVSNSVRLLSDIALSSIAQADFVLAEEELARVRGVRKSQAMLAGFFIRAGRPQLAKRIHDDMAGENREFLAGIRAELFGTQSREFWEIEDR